MTDPFARIPQGNIVPRIGMRFLHSRVLAEDNSPQLYEVTMISRGTAYYRAIYDGQLGGCSECIDTHRFFKVVGEVLP